MWIFLSDSFLSIVDKEGAGDELLVRARRAGDIESVFPEATVSKTPDNDYLYRAHVSRERVALQIADQVRSIRYPNFKNTVRDRARHDAYLDTWQAMNTFQRKSVSGRHRKPGTK